MKLLYSQEVVSEEGEIKIQSVQSSQSWNIKMIELTLLLLLITQIYQESLLDRNCYWGCCKNNSLELNGEPWKTSTHAELTAKFKYDNSIPGT